ncbi:class I SAM-dependent methyltransferase [Pyrococcus kukulkanii]
MACGTGIPTVELANRGYNVTGIDLHEEMLEVARVRS